MQDLDLTKIKGLSEAEAAEILKRDGPNELPTSKPRGLLHIALEIIKEPMFLLLIAGGLIYLALGEPQDALLLFFFVFVVIGITFYQEQKTERALEALRDLSSPRALVIRGGEQRRIAGREVVKGDIIFLSEGDRVPADALFLQCSNLSVDESLLTGESVPVRKAKWDQKAKMSAPGGDDLPSVYSGTLVVSGRGVARVESTGAGTELGKIGRALKSIETEKTLLQKETGVLVRNFALAGGFLCILVVASYGLIQGQWLKGFLAGITTAMAILPEEFPVVLTVFLALGAWRMSKRSVLVSRVPALETLGSASVLCVDKTGTLTMNQMSVAKLYAKGEAWSQEEGNLPEKFHELLEFGILASQKDPFDPMEKAVRGLGDTAPFKSEHIHNDWELIREYPLSPNLLAMSHVWKSPNGEDYVIAVKGAPEAVADLCHYSKKENEILGKHVTELASEGLRVLGVAKANFKSKRLPKEQHDFEFVFLGLIGFSDPVRPQVLESVKDCYSAGIRVIMITGDYPVTASNIARQIGLINPQNVITGPELDAMEDVELQERIKGTNIFARAVPEQKLRIVNALKGNGEIVAMTGDGVNDAPALKSAHIGVAMGKRGTDVARESSALVILDDDFSSIVGAVRMGRRLLDNIKKAMAYIVAVHVPIAGLSIIPVLMGKSAMLFPVHVVFLELIIDPACSIVFEAEKEEEDVMRRKPRNPKKPLFDKRALGLSALQGVSVLVIVFGVYFLFLSRGDFVASDPEAVTVAFTTLVIANLGLILTNLSWSTSLIGALRSGNSALFWVLGGTLALLGLVLYVPFLQNLFHFAPLHVDDILICLGAGVLGILWFEALKFFHRRTRKTYDGPVSP
ncbi:MAG: cation-translocating P-type ATPase [Candidatus Micrarchaeota archaeon]